MPMGRGASSSMIPGAAPGNRDGAPNSPSGGPLGGIETGATREAVYLAGVLLPCLVTVLTITRERSARLAARIVTRQAGAAVAFTLLLAWGGRAILGS